MSQEFNVTIEKLPHCFALPRKATDGSAAYDLYTANDEDIELQHAQIFMVPLGFKTSFPKGVVAKIYIRSGMAKKGLFLINSVGIIDSDYPDEWKLLLGANIFDKKMAITKGTRIAQVIFERVFSPTFEEGEVKQTTNRRGGFGSTGE